LIDLFIYLFIYLFICLLFIGVLINQLKPGLSGLTTQSNAEYEDYDDIGDDEQPPGLLLRNFII